VRLQFNLFFADEAVLGHAFALAAKGLRNNVAPKTDAQYFDAPKPGVYFFDEIAQTLHPRRLLHVKHRLQTVRDDDRSHFNQVLFRRVLEVVHVIKAPFLLLVNHLRAAHERASDHCLVNVVKLSPIVCVEQRNIRIEGQSIDILRKGFIE
jgi:hypothetical protein